MTKRVRITKLNLGPTIEGRHRSVAGSTVIADYIDSSNGQRTLVLERVSAPAAAKSNSKPRRKASPEPVPPPEPAPEGRQNA